MLAILPFALPFDRLLLLGFFAMILWAALSDACSLRIPNAASVVLVLLFPLHGAASPHGIDWLPSVIIAALIFLAGLALFARGWVGGGDVKLLSATALWAGGSLVGEQLLVMALAGGVLAVLVWLLRYVLRYRAAGLAGLISPPPSGMVEPKLPYGIAIAAGAGYAGVKMLIG